MREPETKEDFDCLKRKGLVWLGDQFRKLMRLCYSKTKMPGICWCCGADTGFNSRMKGGLIWCDQCFAQHRGGYYYNGFATDWRGIGRLTRDKKAALKKERNHAKNG